ncbi:hypothetical protein Ancab_012509 [Ancistrocladus abbreviatus]
MSSSSNHRMSSNGTQACAACKYQRRKCVPDCILAPYFPHDRQRQFLNAHKLFGVSNITKIIRNLNPPDKDIAMRTIIYQSDVRAKDPVGGCYRIICDLHHQIEYYKAELDLILHQLAICRAQEAATAAVTNNINNNNGNTSSSNNSDNNGVVMHVDEHSVLHGYNNQCYQGLVLQPVPPLPHDDQRFIDVQDEDACLRNAPPYNSWSIQESSTLDSTNGCKETTNFVKDGHEDVMPFTCAQDVPYDCWSIQQSSTLDSTGRCRETSFVKDVDGEDVKPLIDMLSMCGRDCGDFNPTQVDASCERDELTLVNPQQTTEQTFVPQQQIIEQSEVIILKEGRVIVDEHKTFLEHQAPEHNIRNAATLFTLTN